jgi:hypothetical protein
MKPHPRKSPSPLRTAGAIATSLTLLLTATGYSQTTTQPPPQGKNRVMFHYTPSFKPHLLETNTLHYSNELNDPAYRPTIYTEGTNPVLKLSSWKSHTSLAAADTTLQVLRTINLPPQKKELHVQVDIQGVNPPITKGFKKEATRLSIYFYAGEYKSRGEKKIYPTPEWTTKKISLPIPTGADKAVLELTAADGGEISTKNWKIQIP